MTFIQLSAIPKFNNAACRSTCPVCGEQFKPFIGTVPFLEGTSDPICDECCELPEAEFNSQEKIIEVNRRYAEWNRPHQPQDAEAQRNQLSPNSYPDREKQDIPF